MPPNSRVRPQRGPSLRIRRPMPISAIPVAATDSNGDTLTYTLEGTDAASFGIDSGTGQLSTSAALDYETKDTYSVVVKATDPAGLSGTIDVTINVTDVVEVVPPVVKGTTPTVTGDIEHRRAVQRDR